MPLPVRIRISSFRPIQKKPVQERFEERREKAIRRFFSTRPFRTTRFTLR